MRGKRTRVALAAALVSLAAVAVACGGSDEPGGASPAADTVEIKGFLFKPDKLTIDVGATVTWQNADDIAHTVTSGTPETPTGVFDSLDKVKDQTFAHTFSEVGTFAYFCKNHNGMRGEIDVA